MVFFSVLVHCLWSRNPAGAVLVSELVLMVGAATALMLKHEWMISQWAIRSTITEFLLLTAVIPYAYPPSHSRL